MIDDEDVSTGPYTRVLLVCIYNKCSKNITHDMLYEVFIPFGLVMRILIFVKAKVWKAFVEMDTLDNSKYAANMLNNTVIFEDGSKMMIYPSQLQQINFQNGNNGGVDYQQIRKISQLVTKSLSQKQSYHSSQVHSYYSWSDIVKSQPVLGKQTFSTRQSNRKANISMVQSVSKYQDEGWFSPRRNRKRQSTWNSWYDIESQYEEIAMQSQQYRTLISRPKSKTIILPFHTKQQQFLLDNVSSKVLFIRSIMPYYTIKFIYNILINFGNVVKIVHMIQKQSILAQFQHIQDSIQAKDFLNLVKNGIKIFFSHYQTLSLREISQNEEFQQFYISAPKKEHFNPPSQTLHISYIAQSSEEQLLKLVKQYGSVNQIKWQKHSNNNKSMLLMRMNNMEQAMKVMGFLQGKKVGNKFIKISFTRSKLYDQKFS